jgi:hypothetical protein
MANPVWLKQYAVALILWRLNFFLQKVKSGLIPNLGQNYADYSETEVNS